MCVAGGTICHHPSSDRKHIHSIFHILGCPRQTHTLVSAILLPAAALAFRMLKVLQFNNHGDKWSPVWIMLLPTEECKICINYMDKFYTFKLHIAPLIRHQPFSIPTILGRHPIESHCSLSLVFDLKFTHGLLSVPCGARLPWVWAVMGP